MQQNILLHSGMITPNILVRTLFLLPKNESVLNILGYFLEQFETLSRGLQPLENL